MEAVLEKPKPKKKKVKTASEKASEENSTGLKVDTTENLLKTQTGESQGITADIVEKNKHVENLSENTQEDDKDVIVKEESPETSNNTTDKANLEELLLKLNKDILNKIQISDIKTIETINHTIKSSSVKIDENVHLKEQNMKPYTEHQLSSLYHNGELEMLEDFNAQYVEAELKGLAVKQHPLYGLLLNYLGAREKITENNLELAQCRKEYKELQEQLWTMEIANVEGRSECQDGQVVTASHAYNKSIFHRPVFQSIVRILGNVQKLVYENHVLYSFSAEDYRLQIEKFVKSVISNCLNITGLDKNAPISLTLQSEPAHLQPYLSEMRLCISVLFAFQRKLIRDTQFVDETRHWLSQLVAVLLRLANYQDHLFLLSHVLRCPSGIANWATSFIQLPLDENINDSPFGSYEINHVLTILAAILSPIKERDKFLEDIAQTSETASEALWVMVDSDGEDDENYGVSLRENDLVALLNQLPLDDLFRRILMVRKGDTQDIYDAHLISEHHLLKFLSFSTVLLKILHNGLNTYQQPRYNQFSKRLSRFIRHVAQYATDQWQHFLNVQTIEDRAMLRRLQIEYDAFFLRAIYCLYSSQKLGAWQFLAVVPYNMVTIKTIWRIFYFLHNADGQAKDILNPLQEEDYSRKLWERELRCQFEEKLGGLEDGEVYYLLNTFANMALARDVEDMEFVLAAMKDLLQVGFISETTQETCSKSSRILLTHITSKYPHLLSNILKMVKCNINKIGSLALYLYEELPLSIWQITDEDLDLISRLLLNNSIHTVESKLSRMILSRLNWDSVPYEMHRDVALLVVSGAEQEAGYLQWAWQTVLRLKLHISDRHFTDMARVEDVERYSVLLKGVNEEKPLAIFVAILMTKMGHSYPLIQMKTFQYLLFLQTHQKHEAVLFVLYQIVPMLLDNQEYVINKGNFQQILGNLINADRGYVSMAKSLIAVQNTVLQQMGNMIEAQIANFSCYGLESPRCLVRFWINSLISMPNWNKDCNVMYLLDIIVKSAFFYKDALDVVYGIFLDFQQGTPQENVGSITSLFKWASNGGSNSLISYPLASYPWLAFIVIDIEHQEREIKSGLWRELLIQLSKQKGKTSVDQAIKKAASANKVSSFTSGLLCIYRWAQQALDTPVDHPLLPLLWQKFFYLYLARLPPSTASGVDCVGEKFFDGLVNFAFLKKIKKRLQESVDFYQNILDDDDLDKKDFYKSCHKVFNAFLLWLEEPKLHVSNVLLYNFPPQYQTKLLASIIEENNTPWYEFLDYERVKEEQALCIKMWRVANFREKKNVNLPLLHPASSVESPDPVDRILRRLTSYDTPKPPPGITFPGPVVPQLNFGSKEEMFACLQPFFQVFRQFSHNHTMKISEHKALDCSYQELLPQLYRSVLNKVQKTVPCRGKNQTVHCCGPAVIVLEMQEARINDRIDHQIQTNRNAYESLLAECLQKPALNLCTASVCLRQAIRMLQSQVRCNPASSELGVELFYYVLSLLNEDTLSYLPTKTLFSTCLELLGQSHICGVEHEMPRLVQRILKEPNLGCYLAPHFSPSNVGTTNLLFMYSTICKEIGQKFDVAFALMSKFEVETWLNNKQPKLCQRSQFIQSVVAALTTLGFDPPIEALILHGLYRKHLITVFEFQFPEHYGEVLVHLLRACSGNPETSLVSVSVWSDILNSLSRPVAVHLKAPLREQLRQYATHQHVLQHQELLETAELLSKHFTQERLQYGLYGLYPKCRQYMDVFVLLLGMTGHGLIVSMVNTHQGLLGEKMCEKIWPYLRDLFAPWLVPYSMQNAENMASWIQQLADDRSVLLPWIPADGAFARRVINVFCECITFVMHTLPASTNILSYLWQWYVSSFAHNSVKSHILLPIHECFLNFPWHNFWPSVSDVELMLRVVDQYLPDSHAFLGNIFVSMPWIPWLKNFVNAPAQMRNRVYQCFINLLIKLSNEPNVRKNHAEKAKTLLVQAEEFDWSVLEGVVYQHVMDWCVMSCDASIIFKRDPIDLDYRMLQFLKTVSGYNKPILTNLNADALNKVVIYVRTNVKLISVYASRHKNQVNSRQNEIAGAISRHLHDLEKSVHTVEEMCVLLREMAQVLNIEIISETALKSFMNWLENKPGDGVVVKSVLHVMGATVVNYGIIAELYEVALLNYFTNIVDSTFDPNWDEASGLVNVFSGKQTELEQALLSKGSLLALNAIFLQRINKCIDAEALLNLCLEWMANIKLSETVESKVPLLWLGFLKLSLQCCDKDEASAGAILYKFSQLLLHISQDKTAFGWGRGLLNVIGIGKQGAVSLNFRFLCHALAGYVLAQLPDMKGEPQVVRKVENAPCRVGQPGGNTECPKVLLGLDFGQSQGKIKECAEVALKQIQDPGNSMHNAKKFLLYLLKQCYTKPYLKEIG